VVPERDGEQTIGLAVREWLEEHAIDDGEHRRGERQADRDDARERNRVRRRAPERAPGLYHLAARGKTHGSRAADVIARAWPRGAVSPIRHN
jgi:hypothetical protein